MAHRSLIATAVVGVLSASMTPAMAKDVTEKIAVNPPTAIYDDFQSSPELMAAAYDIWQGLFLDNEYVKAPYAGKNGTIWIYVYVQTYPDLPLWEAVARMGSDLFPYDHIEYIVRYGDDQGCGMTTRHVGSVQIIAVRKCVEISGWVA